MQGTLERQHVSTLTHKHASTQGTMAREHMSTQDTSAREHVSTQDMLAREHVSETMPLLNPFNPEIL